MRWDDDPRPPITADDAIRALVVAVVILLACLTAALIVRADAAQGTPVIDRGAAAYYAPSYDHGGWERIIGRHIAWGQVDPAVAYSPDGYYCARPNVPLGTTLTLTNALTGASLTCVVADAVAPGDQAYWWRHFVIELSWRAWEALGLADGNDVIVAA